MDVMRVQSFLIFVILLVSNIYASPYSDLVEEGDKYYNKFDNLNALKKYEQAYKLDSDDYEILLKLTRTYNDVGEELKELERRDEAEPYISKAVKFAEIFKQKYPDSAAVYAYLALSYGNHAVYVGGKDKIKFAHKIKDNAAKALRMNPDDVLPYIILGIYNRQIAGLSWIERLFANTFFGDVPKGSYEEAIKMFNAALKLKPRVPLTTYQLSRVYRDMDDEKKEKELLTQLLNYPLQDFRDKFAMEKARKRLQDI
jgi:tetratricopeptide (TPR) repeat protein